MPTFDPASIGTPKKPETNPTSAPLKDTDQRWFSEVADLYPSPKDVWDGTGPAPEVVIRKLATRFLEASAVDRIARRFLGNGDGR